MNIPALRRSLLAWFSRVKRPLPWRRTRDPYAIWVSEVMLQQTTVPVVIPYFDRFMKRFPTVAALASSDEDDVLALWSGLGYYSRARNLRAGARQVMEDHGGRFPTTAETAMTIKGVGRYTAGAVTSIAYGEKAAVVDGNVRRVLSRLFAIRGLTDAQAASRAGELLSTRSPGAWNEAMMELGATVCRPQSPSCGRCPVASECRGRERAEHWSALKPRPASVAVRIEMALVERDGAILLSRNPPGGLMAGLLDLPHTGLPRAFGPRVNLVDQCRDLLFIQTRPAAGFRHSMTHHRIEATVFRATLRGKRLPPGAAFHPLEGANALPLGGLTRKALRAAGLKVL
jgi:A/G-specific adenine glycosylase